MYPTTPKKLADAIRDFQNECERAEHTDTEVAHRLLETARNLCFTPQLRLLGRVHDAARDAEIYARESLDNMREENKRAPIYTRVDMRVARARLKRAGTFVRVVEDWRK